MALFIGYRHYRLMLFKDTPPLFFESFMLMFLQLRFLIIRFIPGYLQHMALPLDQVFLPGQA